MINLKATIWNHTETIQVRNEKVLGKSFPLFAVGKHSYLADPGIFVRTSIENDLRIRSFQVHNIHVGNFTAVACETTLCVGSNHDYDSINCVFIPSYDPKFNNKGQILVQNNVWIGHGATIMGGVTIHNGAVVAAGSHVVKDVPAFSIVGGNPARVIKYRFSEDIIKKLQTIKWWNWSSEKIRANSDLINSHRVEEFCNKFYPTAFEEKQSVTIPDEFKFLIGKRVYLYFLDIDVEYPLWQRVIESFCKNLSGGGGRVSATPCRV